MPEAVHCAEDNEQLLTKWAHQGSNLLDKADVLIAYVTCIDSTYREPSV
jgi:hypothetical protein